MQVCVTRTEGGRGAGREWTRLICGVIRDLSLTIVEDILERFVAVRDSEKINSTDLVGSSVAEKEDRALHRHTQPATTLRSAQAPTFKRRRPCLTLIKLRRARSLSYLKSLAKEVSPVDVGLIVREAVP